jgi:hypothetical protein
LARKYVWSKNPDETRRKLSKSLSVARTGMKFTREHCRNISVAKTGVKRCPMKEETKLRIGIANKGRKPWHTGKHLSEEIRDRIRTSNIGQKRSSETVMKIRTARAKQILPYQDTKIERIIQQYLKSKGVQYEKHKLFLLSDSCHRVDLYIPTLKLAIECDGSYWHSLPNVISRDLRVNDELSKQCDLIRLDEAEIRSGEFADMLAPIIS